MDRTCLWMCNLRAMKVINDDQLYRRRMVIIDNLFGNVSNFNQFLCDWCPLTMKQIVMSAISTLNPQTLTNIQTFRRLLLQLLETAIILSFEQQQQLNSILKNSSEYIKYYRKQYKYQRRRIHSQRQCEINRDMQLCTSTKINMQTLKNNHFRHSYSVYGLPVIVLLKMFEYLEYNEYSVTELVSFDWLLVVRILQSDYNQHSGRHHSRNDAMAHRRSHPSTNTSITNMNTRTNTNSDEMLFLVIEKMISKNKHKQNRNDLEAIKQSAFRTRTKSHARQNLQYLCLKTFLQELQFCHTNNSMKMKSLPIDFQPFLLHFSHFVFDCSSIINNYNITGKQPQQHCTQSMYHKQRFAHLKLLFECFQFLLENYNCSHIIKVQYIEAIVNHFASLDSVLIVLALDCIILFLKTNLRAYYMPLQPLIQSLISSFIKQFKIYPNCKWRTPSQLKISDEIYLLDCMAVKYCYKSAIVVNECRDTKYIQMKILGRNDKIWISRFDSRIQSKSSVTPVVYNKFIELFFVLVYNDNHKHNIIYGGTNVSRHRKSKMCDQKMVQILNQLLCLQSKQSLLFSCHYKNGADKRTILKNDCRKKAKPLKRKNDKFSSKMRRLFLSPKSPKIRRLRLHLQSHHSQYGIHTNANIHTIHMKNKSRSQSKNDMSDIYADASPDPWCQSNCVFSVEMQLQSVDDIMAFLGMHNHHQNQLSELLLRYQKDFMFWLNSLRSMFEFPESTYFLCWELFQLTMKQLLTSGHTQRKHKSKQMRYNVCDVNYGCLKAALIQTNCLRILQQIDEYMCDSETNTINFMDVLKVDRLINAFMSKQLLFVIISRHMLNDIELKFKTPEIHSPSKHLRGNSIS